MFNPHMCEILLQSPYLLWIVKKSCTSCLMVNLPWFWERLSTRNFWWFIGFRWPIHSMSDIIKLSSSSDLSSLSSDLSWCLPLHPLIKSWEIRWVRLGRAAPATTGAWQTFGASRIAGGFIGVARRMKGKESWNHKLYWGYWGSYGNYMG